MIILTFVNVISAVAICLCAGSMLSIRDEIVDRITELSMIECRIIKEMGDDDYEIESYDN